MTLPAPAWSPDPEQADASALRRFMDAHDCADYPTLCRRAAQDPAWFWDALVKALGIVWSTPYARVMDTSPGIPFTRWFLGGRLNAYESAVVRHRQANPDRLAGPGRGAGERVRPHDVAETGHQQLGRGAHQPVDAVEHGRRIRSAKAVEDVDDADGRVGLDEDFAGEHDLGELPVAQAVDHGRDGVAPFLRRC